MPVTSFADPGILLIDKSSGMTSHDVVARLRRHLGTRRIGHAGTLDPMATGLLVLGVNAATRLLTFLVGLDKTYEATIRLGASSTTDDSDGELLGYAPADQLARITDDQITAGCRGLTGEIMQVPSSVSAIRIDGKRAHARVRDGEVVQIPPRPVTVARFDVRDSRRESSWIDVDAVIDCSSGTYVRALARDLGFRLGVGAHLTALRRTRVGPLNITEAVRLDDLETDTALLAGARLVSPAAIAERIFPAWHLTPEQEDNLKHGRVKRLESPGHGRFAALNGEGRLVGLVDCSHEHVAILFNMSQESS
ncbi:unannotated protein [freshwater metagenome]|uniref:tRNA pseudouridine(55) synthase n=1 Tax=freshwater metagenome TaxID=449393 RepID=A0A6J7FDN8_9ZZZZ